VEPAFSTFVQLVLAKRRPNFFLQTRLNHPIFLARFVGLYEQAKFSC
jgi:hypothetical protein